MPKRKTNTAFVRDLMEHSAYGPLAQLFVIEALHKWSGHVAKADPADLDNPLISGAAWVGVAKEIHAKLEARMS